MSRRAGVIGLAVALLAGLVTFVVATTRSKSYERETLGNNPAQLTAIVRKGGEACQRPLTLPPGVDRVRFLPAPAANVRGPIVVSVRSLAGPEATSGPVLARAELSRRELTGQPEVVALDRAVDTDGYVSVCVTKRGREDVEVWGEGGGLALSRSTAYEGRRELTNDLFLTFPRPAPVSTLSRMPEAFRHAAPFKLGFMGAWTFWLLAAAVLLAVPAGLAYGLRRAADEDSASA